MSGQVCQCWLIAGNLQNVYCQIGTFTVIKLSSRATRRVVMIKEQHCGFMPRQDATGAMFAVRVLMEKYR